MSPSLTYKDEYLVRYDFIRKTLTDLYPKFFTSIDREAVERSGKRLRVFQKNALLLNTEHESKIFFDYIFYVATKNGLNFMQHAFDKFSKRYEGEVLNIFCAAKAGYFSYLDIVKSCGDAAFIVFDRERKTEHLMIDRGINTLAKQGRRYSIVSHVINFDDFIMTTGAPIPVPLELEEGQQVEDIVNAYLEEASGGDISPKTRLQYITDLYRTCFEEDITGFVKSTVAPFGRNALKERIPGMSDTMH